MMERKLGRKLRPGEVVHHVDEDKCNYSMNNLICFASNADHSAFHNGCEIAYNSEGIAYCPNKSIRIEGKKTRYSICPNCGNLKSSKAHLCKACELEKIPATKISTDLNKLDDLLKKDIKENLSIVDIAAKYGVSHATVRRWLNKCKIEYTTRPQIPPKEELEENLEKYSLIGIANFYQVDRSTIKTWLKKYNIQHEYEVGGGIGQKVRGITTNEIFNSLNKAAKAKYPGHSTARTGAQIKYACEQNIDYKGLYWEFI